MSKKLGVVLAIPAVLLVSCGGGGGDGGGYCSGTFQGGSTGFSCTNCGGVDPFSGNPLPEAIDNNAITLHAFNVGSGGTITISVSAPGGMTFPGGANSGALMRFPAGVPLNASYSLYRNNSPVAATSGGTIATGGVPAGAGGTTYYPVTPSGTIDRIDLVINTSVDAAFQLNEVCGDH